ncbi:MAG TPA: winged helix-turn-helix transcriptional regulator [Solirubrobacterales bacterium]|nr:winged helix-turn-helix transcriptional regulator [Solirubrobacterales bacterium]
MEKRISGLAEPHQATDAGDAGRHVLALLANPLNISVLRAHASGLQRLGELRGQVGNPAVTTLRAAIRNLDEFTLLKRVQVSTVPYGVATELTDAGREMLGVADALESWLAVAPDGPIELDSLAAKSAVKALASGWKSKVVAALASGPLTLTELDKRITDLSYPSLERRLAAMRMTGQVERARAGERRPAFQATDWLRRSVAALYIAARWEQRHLGDDAVPITASGIETAFLTALPLAVLPPGTNGECLLAAPVDTIHSREPKTLAGARVKVEDGQVTVAVADMGQDASTWIVCSAEAWLTAVINGQLDDLRVGGANPQLALDLVLGTHLGLFSDLDE